MSWLIKKSAVDNEGGLEVFTEYLAEDFFIGKALWTRYVVIAYDVCVFMYRKTEDGSLH